MDVPMSDRHIVLIHGAWQGSWAFDAWRPYLHLHGWTSHAVELPGNGWGPNADQPATLDTYVETVTSLLRTLPVPAVVLGHSGGGVIASEVAERAPDLVKAVVYLAGMMLPAQTPYAEVVRQCQSETGTVLTGIGSSLIWNSDRTVSTVPAEAALAHFLHDCPDAPARLAASLLRPQAESGRAITNAVTPERFGRIPRVYIECSQDLSVPPIVQKRMQELQPGAHRLLLDVGHVPQLAKPAELATLLCPVLDKLSLN